jgi:sigma-E factor negative regulatory protein RseA
MSHPEAPSDAADDEPRLWLSRLADGDCDGTVAPRACASWRQDAAQRATWHEYHLIGDLLRSQDLQRPPDQDIDFLASLRVRLAQEPVIMAPMSRPAIPERPHRRWLAPTAAIAGVVAVIGALLVTRMQAPPGAASGPVLAATPAMPAVDANMVRDARIDLYLQAHHGMRGSAAAAMPGGALRNVDMLVPAR